MANLSQLTLPVKDTITGEVTTQTFDLAGSDSKNFIGTRAEWEALTQAEKEEYDTMDIYGEYNDDPIDPVPTQGSTNAVASGGVYTGLQNVETNIAGIESSATASQAYTVGKYIIFGNVLYKVIASIAQGDTLVIGTNIQAAKIADEVSDHLTVNGTEFYFDSHDGVFGYNTSPNRGADTFVPFKSSIQKFYIVKDGDAYSTYQKGGVTNYPTKSGNLYQVQNSTGGGSSEWFAFNYDLYMLAKGLFGDDVSQIKITAFGSTTHSFCLKSSISQYNGTVVPITNGEHIIDVETTLKTYRFLGSTYGDRVIFNVQTIYIERET